MSQANQWKQCAVARVEEERTALLELSARIHANPELRFEERQASAWLADYLSGIGYEVERGAYGLPTAFAARMGRGAPRVAVLCEYDALPGVGHACGHNIIAAAGAGAGAGLAAVVGQTGGTVVILGTPAEEGGGGKIAMAAAGAFAGLDAALMVHPAGMDLSGMQVLALSQVEVEYHGEASHASAAPHRGVNALDALVTAYTAIGLLRQHIRPSERIHGIITDGGQSPNIVPARAAGVFLIRAATERRLERLRARVHGCFAAGADATGARLTVRTVGADYADMLDNAPLAAAYAANMEHLGRVVRQATEGGPLLAGSTDMGNVSKLVPAIHPMIAVAPPRVPLHSEEFARWAGSDAADQAVLDGAKALAMTAVDVLGDAALRAAAHGAFTAGRAAEGTP